MPLKNKAAKAPTLSPKSLQGSVVMIIQTNIKRNWSRLSGEISDEGEKKTIEKMLVDAKLLLRSNLCTGHREHPASRGGSDR
jgi:hypothetical protein